MAFFQFATKKKKKKKGVHYEYELEVETLKPARSEISQQQLGAGFINLRVKRPPFFFFCFVAN